MLGASPPAIAAYVVAERGRKPARVVLPRAKVCLTRQQPLVFVSHAISRDGQGTVFRLTDEDVRLDARPFVGCRLSLYSARNVPRMMVVANTRSQRPCLRCPDASFIPVSLRSSACVPRALHWLSTVAAVLRRFV